MASPNNGAGYRGFLDPNTAATPWGAQAFAIKQLINQISTATVVKVAAVTNDGGLSPVGFVDVIPQVNQVDGNNNSVPHGTIYRCPYSRMQGGANAIIMDPQVGDLGVAVFADRDISSVVANKGQANPGSRRRFDWSDAIYIGGLLNGAPSQYVQFNEQGITVSSPTAVILDAPDVRINASTLEIAATASVTVTTPTFTVNGLVVHNGATELNGTISQTAGATGGTTASLIGPVNVATDVTASGKSLATHRHSGVEGGSDDTGGPV